MRALDFLRLNARWLGAGMLLTFLSSFGQTFFISIFAGEIREAFSLSHGQWGLTYTIGTSVSAAVMVWAGALTDRFRVRALGTVILAALAVACLSMAMVPGAAFLTVAIFGLRLTGQGMASHTAVVGISRWFVATRGKALAVAALGIALGEAILPITFVALMAVFDWRILWVVCALVALAGIPFLRALLTTERTPQSLAEESQSLGMGGRHWTRREALNHKLFWFMVPALLGPAAFNTAFFFQQVHYAEVKGWEHLTLVAFFPFYTAFAIGAMALSGWALDKLGTARLIPWFQLPMVAAFLLFSVASEPIVLLAGFFFLALTTGANSTLPNAFWAEFYGTAHLGAIKATAAAVMVLGSAIGPGLTGVFLDLGVGIEQQYVWVAAYFVFTTILMVIGVAQSRRDLPLAA